MSRREVLKSLTRGVATGSMMCVIPVEVAERVHSLIERERAPGGGNSPKFFDEHQYKTLQALCEAIIPAHEDSGGAIKAGAPEFIDLLTSENADYQLKLGGGILWLDSACGDRFGTKYLDCSGDQQRQMLESIAYRKNAQADPGLSQGIVFFSLLRSLTADGYFTSKIGIQYLGYIGNASLAEFPGCPDTE